MHHHNKNYIELLKKYKIAHISTNLKYDLTNNRKIMIPPSGWQKTTFNNSSYDPSKNAIMQLCGSISNILVIDIDGLEHPTNKYLSTLCLQDCQFYNRTRKGYHFFFTYDPIFIDSQSIKFENDSTNSGIDLLSNNRNSLYGYYYIGNQLIKYENIKNNPIQPMTSTIKEALLEIFSRSNIPLKKGRPLKKYPNAIITLKNTFPKTSYYDIQTIDSLINCINVKYFNNFNDWFVITMIIKHINNSQESFNIFTKYSRSIPKYSNTTDQELLHMWNSIKYNIHFNPTIILYMARRDNKTLFNKIKLEWLNFNNTYKYEIINQNFLSFNTIYHPYIQHSKVIGIKSQYGTGKTQLISNIIHLPEYLQHDKRILFITPRVSLAYSFLSTFKNFEHYKAIDTYDLHNVNKLIIQIDSLYRIQNVNHTYGSNNDDIIKEELQEYMNNNNIFTQQTNFNYDIVILDEIESLLFHLSYEKLSSYNIYNILLNICNNSKKIIALDGDLSDRSYSFLKAIKQDSEPKIIHNEYKVQPKHFIFTNCQESFNEKIINDLQNNKNIVIISMSLDISEYYYELLKNEYNVILHNSNQNNKEILTDINTNWKSARVLIYTSVIESGCDFNQKWFDTCYVILSCKSTVPRALMQMLSRVRHFTSNIIHIYTNKIPFYEFQYPYTYEEIKMSTFKQYLLPDNTLSTLNQILCYNYTENINKNYFITVLTNLLRMKGHTYEYVRIDKSKKIKHIDNIYQEIADAPIIKNSDELKLYEEQIKLNPLNCKLIRQYNCIHKKINLCKIWNLNPDELIEEDVKLFYHKTSSLYKFESFIKKISYDLLIQPKNSSLSQKNIITSKHLYINQIISKFRIKHRDDFKFSIDCGITDEGRKKKKKENPNKINRITFLQIIKELKSLITNTEFRQIWNLPKIKKDISDKETIENIKKVISEFGFVLMNVDIVNRILENRKSKFKKDTYYYIDLNNGLIDFYQRKTYDDVDYIMTIVNDFVENNILENDIDYVSMTIVDDSTEAPNIISDAGDVDHGNYQVSDGQDYIYNSDQEEVVDFDQESRYFINNN
jgi:hypothetical protein